MADDSGAAAPPRVFTAATSVRRSDGQRFLWGDEDSGQIADVIYGRGTRISAVTFSLGPGHWFGASKTWKPLYDQHRFYYVARGTLAIHDPETGDVAVAGQGEAIGWQGARYHFGYNVGNDDVLVLDWFAPPERPLDMPEISLMPSKRELEEVVGGRYELLERWPAAAEEQASHARRDGGVVLLRESEALHVVHGTRRPQLMSILYSTPELTGGTFTVRGGTHTEAEQHPGDEVVYALSGELHVRLPESGDWLELGPLDVAFIPGGTPHEYWSYGGAASKAVFCIAPGYR